MRLLLTVLVALTAPAYAASVCTKCTTAQTALGLSCTGCVDARTELSNLCVAIASCGGSTPPTTVTTTTAIVTPTTLPSGGGTIPGNVVTKDPDGTSRWLKSCDDLPSWRDRDVARNQMLCGRNGDVYYSDSACHTGTQRPVSMPWILGAPYQGFAVPSGSIIYPGRYGGDAPGWMYKATPTAGAPSCVLGAAPPAWCKTDGCTVGSGTCSLMAQPFAVVSFTDGTCLFKNGGADIGAGGGWGPTAGYEEGKQFPRVGQGVSWGDNNMTYAYSAGRREYGGIDESTFEAGLWGNSFSGAPGTYVAAGYPGFAIGGSPTLGIATAPPLVLTPLSGTEPTGNWGCYGLAWQNTLGGRTRLGPQTLICAPFTSGGLRVSMPERGGWVWPRPFPVGQTMGAVFRMTFPGPPCQPLPGQTQCQPILPKETFLEFFDYLYGPTDFLDQKGQGTPERGGEPGDVNASGYPINPMTNFEHSIGIGPPCTAGGTGYNPGTNCYLNPTNGWWYQVIGDQCVEPLGPGKGAHCDDSSHAITLPNPLPTVWRTDQLPFCAGGVCFRRSIPTATGTIFRGNGYMDATACTWRYQEVRAGADGAPQVCDIMALCAGELRWYRNCDLRQVAFRINAGGAGVPTAAELAVPQPSLDELIDAMP